MRKTSISFIAAAALSLSLAGTARAVVVVAVPGSFEAGFATPATIARPGVPLTFANADLEPHNVIALEAKRPNGSKPWCSQYQSGRCPLFWSATISAGSTEVLGLEDTTPGASYQFYCSIHPDMVGTLVMAPA